MKRSHKRNKKNSKFLNPHITLKNKKKKKNKKFQIKKFMFKCIHVGVVYRINYNSSYNGLHLP